MELMRQINTRAEFERSFHMLHRALADGRFMMTDQISTEGIERVRFLPNRRVDFLSVDEQARSLANMLGHMQGDKFKEMAEPGKSKDESTLPATESGLAEDQPK